MQRLTKTDEKIKKAFIDLMKVKGFDHLTVSDITNNAKINRSTFYSHYEDKYALEKHFEDMVLNELSEELNSNLDSTMKYQDISKGIESYPVINTIVDYIESEFDLIKVLMGSTGTTFESRVKDVLYQVVNHGLYLAKGNSKMVDQIPNDYAYEIVVSGILNTMKFWLFKDNPEDKDTIVDIIMKTRYLSPYDLLGVDNQFGKTIKV
ncbi:TetR/AcrR family transcriptional regulator C-terminal domain-containing protein [Companilactobacillus insicii]|uniref:TetR/AcrR family transcriptional regulator C-terminal domain-containing protein n=1 Tax=Companilactobacillus insicii TaxID=1732567 RepID=UPI000F7A78D1|nr:TetR/AcrR family transcriptional regulator C-terminal domain-containing protein [Companilactobacillus insicii]